MTEEKKGSTFRRLFLRDTEEAPEQKVVSPQANIIVPQVEAQKSNYLHPYPGVVVQVPVNINLNSSLIDDFVDRLQKLIDDNNQPGFDFLEYTQTLFESSPNPGVAEYRMVFTVARKMQSSLTPQFLLESARAYKAIVDSAASSVVNDGQTRKNSLIQEMEGKRLDLQNSIQSNEDEVKKLLKKIEELRQDSQMKTNQLALIQQEYDPKFADIDSKILAMTTAKEKVITSIVDVETGINNHIKV
jgi:hypothetical protein